ncbi:MAG: putative transport system permease protein [Actinomycetota bacterium]|nr:putative transport system permease protein [Actinomycetota bacterium]
MRARARWIDPAWLKAPLLLVRFPAIFFSLVIAALILGSTTAAAPFLLSSAGNAALDQELETVTDEQAGLSFSTFGFVDRAAFSPANAQVKDVAGSIDRLGPSLLTVEGASTRIANQDGETSAVRFMFRRGALANVKKLTPDRGIDGVWISDSNAEELGVGPGDQIVWERLRGTRSITVAGIYRNLASEPISEFWRPLTFDIINPSINQPPLYPYLLMNIGTLLDVGTGVGQQATFSWEFPLRWTHPTLPEAEQVAATFNRAKLEASDPLTNVGRALNGLTLYGSLDVHTSLTTAIKNARDTVTAIEGPVTLISLAGRLVALAVLGAAGLFAFTKRKVEARLLSAQGRTPWWQGAKAAVEAAVPVLAGGAAGWALGAILVRVVGPSNLISPDVPLAAAKEVGLWLAGAVGLLGVVYGIAAHQESQLGASRLRQAIGRVPWEMVVLLLAGVSLYEVLSREGAIVESADKAAKIDLLLLAFPFLFIAGIAGLAARGLRRLLPRLRQTGGDRSSWSFLAIRRFAGAQKTGFLLITASAIALGVLVYSSTLVATTSRTVRAKAQVLAGSDVAAAIQNVEDIPDDFPFPSTVVSLTSGDVFPGDERVSILAVDPQTFERGAFWDGSFSDEPLRDLLGKLASDGPRLPVILAGTTAPEEATVDTRAIDIPITVVDEVTAWPGMVPNRPLMVVDATTMSRIAQQLGSLPTDPFAVDELWVKGDPDKVVDAIDEAQLVVEQIKTAAEVQDAPSLRSLSWTFGFLQALGFLAGAIALVGLVLYLQSRQQSREVSYALARRMGLSRGDHRLAVAVELAAMLASAGVIGGISAVIAARLVASQIDPLPGLPPGTLFGIPVLLLAAAPVILLIVAMAGAWRVQRRADRMNVAEVMRLAT